VGWYLVLGRGGWWLWLRLGRTWLGGICGALCELYTQL